MEWEKLSNGKAELIGMIKRNTLGLAELRDKIGETGIKKLYSDYGITHFGRYQPELLIKQLEDEKENVPYGVYLSAYADRNGALDEIDGEGLVKMAVGQKLKIKFVEARDKFSVVRRIMSLVRKFPGHKIEFRCINGHGDANSVRLGVDPDDDCLTTDDLEKGSAEKMKGFYTEHCPTFFDSCSTGLGIGPAYSQYGDGYSMSPDRPITGRGLDLKKDTKGNLFFDGQYFYGGTTEPKKVIYKGGKEAKEEIKAEREKMAEIRHQIMIHDKELMTDLWEKAECFPVLLGVIRKEKLDPLKKLLKEKYGALGTIEVESVNNRSDENGYAIKDDLSLADDGPKTKWSSSFVEDVGSGAQDIYHGTEEEKANYWPEIRVVTRDSEGKKIVLDRYKLDMTDLWPENIGKIE